MSDKRREAESSATACPPYPNGAFSAPPGPPTQNDDVTVHCGQPQPYFGTSPLQGTQYWTVVPATVGCVTRNQVIPHPDAAVPPPKAKSLLEAYLLGLPLGVLGAHHFYLGRPAFGVMYFFTLGLLGCGWLVDLLRMPCLVASVNKENRERHQQLQELKLQLQQQQLQVAQQHGAVAAAVLHLQPNVVFLPFAPRSLGDAYILWFPFGLLGFHHFYLRNYGFGVLYFFTFGLLGIGWLVDLCRMPSLVREANSPRYRNEVRAYSQGTAHVFGLSPAGILGGHHFYLDRPLWGCLYLFTLGLLGVGWVFDWFRLSCLVKRANAIRLGERSPDRKYLDDAYILCFPLGFTGLHHFYLRRYGWGVLYFFTLGVFGIGWLVDWFRLPLLVRDHNNNLELSPRLIQGRNGTGSGTGSGSGNGGGSVMINPGIANQTQVAAAAPPCSPVAGYGYTQTTYPSPAAAPPCSPVAGYGYTQITYPSPAAAAGNYPAYIGPGYAPPAPPSYEATMETKNTASKE